MMQEFKNAIRMSRYADSISGIAIGESGKFHIERDFVRFYTPHGKWIQISEEDIAQQVDEILSA